MPHACVWAAEARNMHALTKKETNARVLEFNSEKARRDHGRAMKGSGEGSGRAADARCLELTVKSQGTTVAGP